MGNLYKIWLTLAKVLIQANLTYHNALQVTKHLQVYKIGGKPVDSYKFDHFTTVYTVRKKRF